MHSIFDFSSTILSKKKIRALMVSSDVKKVLIFIIEKQITKFDISMK